MPKAAIEFYPLAWEQYCNWLAQDRKITQRINTIINDICHSPFDGIGKPEALKHDYQGYWSRRITDAHRLVYRVSSDGTIIIIRCYGHYND